MESEKTFVQFVAFISKDANATLLQRQSVLFRLPATFYIGSTVPITFGILFFLI
jgi:hypothetical protein